MFFIKIDGLNSKKTPDISFFVMMIFLPNYYNSRYLIFCNLIFWNNNFFTKLLQKMRYLPFWNAGHYVPWYFGAVSVVLILFSMAFRSLLLIPEVHLNMQRFKGTITVSHGTVNSSLRSESNTSWKWNATLRNVHTQPKSVLHKHPNGGRRSGPPTQREALFIHSFFFIHFWEAFFILLLNHLERFSHSISLPVHGPDAWQQLPHHHLRQNSWKAQ